MTGETKHWMNSGCILFLFRQEVEDSLLTVEAGKINFDEPRLRTSPIV